MRTLCEWLVFAVLVMVALAIWASASAGQSTRVKGQVELAVVRIESHGASCVAIYSDKNGTWFLGCGHMLSRPQDLTSRFKLNGPRQPYAPQAVGNTRLVHYDRQADLSLLYNPLGPMYYVPVAPPGHRPSGQCWSVGYDEMKWLPGPTKRPATITGGDQTTIFTRERPWHGRSGGLLSDKQGDLLIGIVQGYTHEGPKPQKWSFREVDPRFKGLYVSHNQVLRFLAGCRPELIPGGVLPQQPQYKLPVQPFCPPGMG